MSRDFHAEINGVKDAIDDIKEDTKEILVGQLRLEGKIAVANERNDAHHEQIGKIDVRLSKVEEGHSMTRGKLIVAGAVAVALVTAILGILIR